MRQFPENERAAPKAGPQIAKPTPSAYVKGMREVDRSENIYEPEFIWPGKEPDNPDWDDSAERTAQIGRGIGYFIYTIAFGGVAAMWLWAILFSDTLSDFVMWAIWPALYTAIFAFVFRHRLGQLLWRLRRQRTGTDGSSLRQ